MTQKGTAWSSTAGEGLGRLVSLGKGSNNGFWWLHPTSVEVAESAPDNTTENIDVLWLGESHPRPAIDFDLES